MHTLALDTAWTRSYNEGVVAQVREYSSRSWGVVRVTGLFLLGALVVLLTLLFPKWFGGKSTQGIIGNVALADAPSCDSCSDGCGCGEGCGSCGDSGGGGGGAGDGGDGGGGGDSSCCS